MVSISQAREIAKRFVKERGEVLPGIFYGISEAKEYGDCFYFNFLLVDKDGELLPEPLMVGGALVLLFIKLQVAQKLYLLESFLP